MKKQFVISLKEGIHARPATLLVATANKYQSTITMKVDDVTVDMKSIMGVLSLAIKRGTLVTVEVNGPDAIDAMQALTYKFAEVNNS